MHPRRTRGRRLASAAAGLAVLLTAGLGACGDSDGASSASPGAAPRAETLRIGDQGRILRLPLTLSGEDQGTTYKLDWNNFTDGPQMNAAFGADRLDVGWMGETPLLFANAADVGTIAVAVMESSATGQASYASAGSGIRDIVGLRGKRVAVIFGTVMHGYLLAQLDAVGLRQDDITTANVPMMSLPATLASGQVDAVVGVTQFAAALKAQNPGARQLEASPQSQHTVLVASRKALADPARREAVRDFVVRVSRAWTWPKAHPDEWVQEYYVKTLKQDPAAARRYYDTLPSARFTPVIPTFIDGQRTQARLFGEVGELPKALDVDDELDVAFNAELTRAFTAAHLPTTAP